jgi:DNA polymerase III epsilon subunit-like protein
VVMHDDRVIAVAAVTVADGRITEIDLVANPDKLQRIASSTS